MVCDRFIVQFNVPPISAGSAYICHSSDTGVFYCVRSIFDEVDVVGYYISCCILNIIKKVGKSNT